MCGPNWYSQPTLLPLAVVGTGVQSVHAALYALTWKYKEAQDTGMDQETLLKNFQPSAPRACVHLQWIAIGTTHLKTAITIRWVAFLFSCNRRNWSLQDPFSPSFSMSSFPFLILAEPAVTNFHYKHFLSTSWTALSILRNCPITDSWQILDETCIL